MEFGSRITRHPIPFNVERGREVSERYPSAVVPLIDGAAGCSPYLATLAMSEADWAAPALEATPEAALEALLAEAAALPSDGVATGLRRLKRRVALLTGLADLGGVWALGEVTGALTRFADAAIDRALKAEVEAQIRRGKLPGASEEDIADAAGMVVFAMGKMGAYELNYSSDIDLICLFDETRFAGADIAEARSGFVRATRRMTATLSEITGEGYVFRTDLRLRPDASVTPVCLSMDSAERYYESEGRAWERAVWIKGRVAAGDAQAGQRFLDRIRPFVWRRHLDFAAIEDTHEMLRRIRSAKGFYGPITLEGHNVKLGKGGIREIEFFTQTRQLIAGGRDERLRVRGTVEGLKRLTEAKWVPEEVTWRLSSAYLAHREVEHRLQMVRDAQTHSLPNSAEEFDRLARFMGAGDTAQFRADLLARFEEVADLAEDFFAPSQDQPEDGSIELEPAAREVVERWPGYPALRSPRAEAIFRRVRPMLFDRIDRAPDPAEALAAFDGFLRGLPAGVQVFSLFEANPQLIDLMVDIAGTVPRLAAYLSRNAGVFDAVIGGEFFAPWPGAKVLEAGLTAQLAGIDDYERQLDMARAWAKEWHFRIGVHQLRGLTTARDAGRAYADLADAVVRVLWPVVVAQFAQKHGPPPGRGAAVLAMGSAGAAQLNAGSDLDLIVIYDPAGVEASDGRRPLAARAYFARLTQALVTALSAPTAEGKLYEVDMRLRPSGRQGPVATSLAAFQSYQTNEAWTWEHLALTRARVVTGQGDLADEIEGFRRGLLADMGVSEKILTDLRDMRERIATAKPAMGAWDAKAGPGGLMDIELLVSAAALMAGDPATRVSAQMASALRIDWLDRAAILTLSETYDLLWRLRSISALLSDTAPDPGALGGGARALLLRETGAASIEALSDALAHAKASAAAVIEAALARPPKEQGGSGDRE